MLLCRTGRLSAAALDQAFKSTGSFLVQVKANRLGDVTLALRKRHTVHRCFCVSVWGANSTLVHPVKQQQEQQEPNPHPVQGWDSSCGFVIPDRGHLDRGAAVAVNSDIIRRRPLDRANRRHSSRGEPVGDVLFTGTWGVSSRLCSTGTMQTRAASTAAAAAKKERDAAEQQTADSNKGEQQNSKEASTTSSSTATAPGDPEPEGGKPSKTQQLKKVFKEYGAVGVSFHVVISLMSLGMFYVLISSGIDMAAVLCKLGFSEAVVRSKMAAGTSTFVLAYAIHKLFAPLRISITLVSVPLIVRHFRKTGLFKPPTPAP